VSGIRVTLLVFALVFVGILGWGVKTGRMPDKGGDIDRTRQPIMFWIGGAMFAFYTIICLYVAFTAT
jgi:hypothetical protein